MCRLILLLMLGAWLPFPAWANVQVFVSVAPLKYFVERIGGELVDVEVMVKSGHSPVTYEPTPRQMVVLSEADVFVRVGVPFETSWISKLQEVNPGMTIVDCREGISLLPLQHKTLDITGSDHNHDHAASDPHIWLDPSLVKTIIITIRDQLIRLDGVNRTVYELNTERFQRELELLDYEIRHLMASINNPKFLVFHPAWGYFARAYGLEQIPVEYEGKEPGPSTLAALIDTVKQLNIGTVFVQRQFSEQMMATLAAEIDAKVAILDPLAEDYMTNLRTAARAIAGSQTAVGG